MGSANCEHEQTIPEVRRAGASPSTSLSATYTTYWYKSIWGKFLINLNSTQSSQVSGLKHEGSQQENWRRSWAHSQTQQSHQFSQKQEHASKLQFQLHFWCHATVTWTPPYSTGNCTLLKMPPAKQPKYLPFHGKLMRLNMLGTKNIVFKSADWLPEEMVTDQKLRPVSPCFPPLAHSLRRKKKYLHSNWFKLKSKSCITCTAADIFEAGIFEMRHHHKGGLHMSKGIGFLQLPKTELKRFL